MNYYQYPPFTPYPYGNYIPSGPPINHPLHKEASVEGTNYENLLRLNLGKTVAVYMNFENSQWGSKIFKGLIEAIGKDHLIIFDSNNNMRYLLLLAFLNYITFEEEVNYYYPTTEK